MLVEFLNPGLIQLSAVLFVISFIIWELPRSLKIIDEEYTKDVYPQGGKVFDYIVFIIGLIAAAFFFMNMDNVISAMKMPTYSLAFTVIYIAVPLLIIFGFIRRVLKRINNEKHDSIVVFIINCFLDLSHTVFFITFSMLLVPVVIFFAVRQMLGMYV
jgi:hypothetical protein